MSRELLLRDVLVLSNREMRNDKAADLVGDSCALDNPLKRAVVMNNGTYRFYLVDGCNIPGEYFKADKQRVKAQVRYAIDQYTVIRKDSYEWNVLVQMVEEAHKQPANLKEPRRVTPTPKPSPQKPLVLQDLLDLTVSELTVSGNRAVGVNGIQCPLNAPLRKIELYSNNYRFYTTDVTLGEYFLTSKDKVNLWFRELCPDPTPIGENLIFEPTSDLWKTALRVRDMSERGSNKTKETPIEIKDSFKNMRETLDKVSDLINTIPSVYEEWEELLEELVVLREYKKELQARINQLE
ncbi:MAG: hypothetical protein MJA29_08575, partial [Candidatus Omnitrophica bacterium]|nr:hypothetical protein [Candidatus Omnitrophota bacterium]